MTELSQELSDAFLNNNLTIDVWNDLQQRYSVQTILAELADQIYNQKSINMEDVVYSLKDIPYFKTQKSSVKTIGTFYFRMYNGGVEKVISLLTDIWIKKGYNVVLFTDEEPTQDDFILNQSVKRVIVPALRLKPNKEHFFNRAKAWKEFIEKYNIDIMVYHAWLSEFFVFDEIALKSTGIPFIVYAHGTFSTGLTCVHSCSEYMSLTQEKTYSMCDTIVTLSSVDNKWWSELGIPCKQVLNPPSYSIGETEVSPLDSKTILWIGRFSSEKQIYEAIKAVGIAHETVPDIRLLILGKGETEECTTEVKDYIANHGMSDYVILEGFQTSVKPFYQQAALTLITSKFEGFPMVALESAISGVPIVLYELPNLELVRKNSGVTVVPQGDLHGLAAKIAELLQNDTLRKQKGQAIRHDVEKMFNRDLGESWREIFEFSLSYKPPLLPKYQRDEVAAAEAIILQHMKMNVEFNNKIYHEQEKWIEHLEKDICELNTSICFISDELEKARQENKNLIEHPRPLGFTRCLIKRMLKKIIKRTQ